MPPKKRARTTFGGPPTVPVIAKTIGEYCGMRFPLDHKGTEYIIVDVAINTENAPMYKVNSNVGTAIIIREKAVFLDPDEVVDDGTLPMIIPGGGKPWPDDWIACVRAHIVPVGRRTIQLVNARKGTRKSLYVRKHCIAAGAPDHPDAGSCEVSIEGVTHGVDDVPIPADLDVSSMRGPHFTVYDNTIDALAVRNGDALIDMFTIPGRSKCLEWEDGWEDKIKKILS